MSAELKLTVVFERTPSPQGVADIRVAIAEFLEALQPYNPTIEKKSFLSKSPGT